MLSWTLYIVDSSDSLARLKVAHRWIVVVTAVVVFGIGLLLCQLLEEKRLSESRGQALEVSARMARQIEQHLTQNLAATYALAALVRQGRGDVRNFEAIATEFLALHPGVSALQLAPAGVIRQIVPYGGNEKAVGHNLLVDEKRNKEALLALQTKKLTLAGPFELIQGGEAVIGRLPVFLEGSDGSFWGFTIALIRMGGFLKTTQIEELEQQGYGYELWRRHPDTGEKHVFAHSLAVVAGEPVTAFFDVPNGRWYLSLAPATGWMNRQQQLLQILIALLVAVTSAWLISRYLRTQRSLAESSARYRTLYKKTPAIMHSIDVEGKLIGVSDQWLTTLGYTEDEVIGRKSTDFLTEESRHRAIEEVLPEFFKTGVLTDTHYQVVAKDGHILDVLLSAISERDADNRIVRSLAVMTDITERKAIYDRMKQSEASLLEAQGIAHIGNWAYDLKTRELFWSNEVFNILEIDSVQDPPTSRVFLDLIHPDERDRVIAAYHRFRNNYQAYEITSQLLMPDGIVKYVSQRTRAVSDSDGRPLRFVGTLQDVTLQTLQDMAFKESEERFRTIADYTYDWEYWQGTQKEMLYISPSCERITGYSASEFICDHELIIRIIHPDDRDAYVTHKHEISGKPHGEMTFRIVTKDGQIRWIAHGCRAVTTHDGQPRGRRGSNRDITDLKQAEQLAHQLAYFDSLTNLPNRRMLLDRLRHGLAQAKRFQRSLAVMFLDLDRFKQVNDTLGHDAGDKLLVEVAARLAGCVRQGDTVARTGGDEFIVVLPEISQPSDVTTVAEKILEAIGEPILIAGHTVDTSTSIGIAVYPVNGSDDADELMKKADSAMYEAKQAGRDRYRLFGA